MGIQENPSNNPTILRGVIGATSNECKNVIESQSITSKNEYRSARNPREREARRLWRQANAVCFDVDSTVCVNEAIDDFAAFLGVSNQVAQCTRDAMTGEMTFREALERRLSLMRPTREQFAQFKQMHEIRLTPGISELISELRSRNTDVYLVSGGFRYLIQPIADLLNVSYSNIFANEIIFNKNGHYAGFDITELTSDSGSKEVGKAGVCGLLKSRKNYKTIVMVGDGATDAEASPPADAFIGFGGNQLREGVRKLADWYVMEFSELHAELLNDDDKTNLTQ